MIEGTIPIARPALRERILLCNSQVHANANAQESGGTVLGWKWMLSNARTAFSRTNNHRKYSKTTSRIDKRGAGDTR